MKFRMEELSNCQWVDGEKSEEYHIFPLGAVIASSFSFNNWKMISLTHNG